VITNDARFIHEVESRIATAKAAFNKEEFFFTGKLGLNLSKKAMKCHI
jgi:hypothetical protein